MAAQYRANKFAPPEPNPQIVPPEHVMPADEPKLFDALSAEEELCVLVRLPRVAHAPAQGVCARWRAVLRSEGYIDARRSCPLTNMPCLEPLVIVAGGGYEDTDHNNSDAGGWRGMMNHGLTSMLLGDRWVHATPMAHPTNEHALVECQEEIYAIGGHHGYTTANADRTRIICDTSGGRPSETIHAVLLPDNVLVGSTGPVQPLTTRKLGAAGE